MTDSLVRDVAALEQAVAQAAAIRPAYAGILGFYGPVFAAQAEAAAHTHPAPIHMQPSMLEMQLRQGFSFISPAAFTVDERAAGTLLLRICRIAISSGEKLARVGQALARAMADGMALNGLFSDVLDDRGRIRDLAGELGVASDELRLLFYLAIRPSIDVGVRQLAAYLKDGLAGRGNCPICGSVPLLGELDAEGKQWLHCQLCWHRWPTDRLACPFCNNRDADSREYFYSDREAEYRVNLCQECKQYLKVVDTRKMDRCFYPPLEQVVSLHLDMLAAGKGYITNNSFKC